MTTEIIHLSDLHIGLSNHEINRAKKLFKVIATAYPKTPVLITGDLTDSATVGQFEATRGLLDELAVTNPVLTVPGNHDYAWKGNVLRDDGWENWTKYLGSPLGWGRDVDPWMYSTGLGVWETEDVVYFGVDSGDPEDAVISARGYISEGLAISLQEALRMCKGKTRVVFLHHHPFTDGYFTRLYGAEFLMASIRNHCEILLFGHEHEYGIWWNQRGIPLIVSSHKSTSPLSGDCLGFTVIDVKNYKHWIEII